MEDSEEADEMMALISAGHLARLQGLLTKAASERKSFFERFAAELQVQL